MDAVNQKIIQCVIEKANKVCPESLALIGIYGSAATGDTHEKSDLDLLLLIEDENGYKLASGFLLEDRKVGYDIYCTTWSGLEFDAQCHHAHLSKLMDAQIVYIRKPEAYDRLCALRARAAQFLASQARILRAEELVNKAKTAYANACLHEGLGLVRLEACRVISALLSALMLCHGAYFKLGTKRIFEELAALPLDPVFAQRIQMVAACKEVLSLRDLLKQLILYAERHICRQEPKARPSEALRGTYEEMYSNWKNKLPEAAANGAVYSSFMNLAFFGFMLSEIAEGVDIRVPELMGQFDPDDLAGNAAVFDSALEDYLEEYRKAGISPVRFSDADAFVAAYLETDEK